MLRSPLTYYIPAFASTFGAKVYYMICGLYHIQVVFYDDHGVAGVDQPGQHLQKLFHIVKMKARCRLIE